MLKKFTGYAVGGSETVDLEGLIKVSDEGEVSVEPSTSSKGLY